MGLKDLVKNIRKGAIINDDGQHVEADRQTFLGVKYDLTSKQLTQTELKEALFGMLKIIEANETSGQNELTDEQKKRFILDFYRFAFAQESRATGCFHPSEISTETTLCHRKMYFQKGRVKKDHSYVPFTSDNRMQRLVDLGTLEHLYIQDNLDRAGILVDMETPVVDPRIGVEGKADGLVDFYGFDDLQAFYDEIMVLEVKTINSYGFKALRRAKPEHLKQASIYGGTIGYKYICFLYICKDNSEHKVFVHPVNYDYFNGFKIEAKSVVDLFNQNARTARSKKVEDHSVIPARVCHNPTNGRAIECAYRDYCFKLNK